MGPRSLLSRSGLAFALAATVALAGCDPCERLESSVCDDLGEEDCKIWKEDMNRVGLPAPSQGEEACKAGMQDQNYAQILSAAKEGVRARKSIEGAQERLDETKKLFEEKKKD